MSGPLSPPMQVDVGEAFGFVFRSHNWFGRLAVGALCLLFFWLIFIPLFILLGYCIEIARTISRGGRELPPWTDIGTKLKEGFVLAVVLFIWGLPDRFRPVLGPPSIAWECPAPTLPMSWRPGGTLYATAWLADSGDLEPVSGGWLYIRL